MRQLLFLFPVVVLLCVACDHTPSYYYQQQESIPTTGWKYEDTKEFSFEIQDTSKLYAILLDVYHTTDYPFQNLYYSVETDFPSGKHLEQVISTNLAHKSGLWLGECSGKNCNLEIRLQEKTYFNEVGKYKISISQYSRNETLEGIHALKLKLKELSQL